MEEWKEYRLGDIATIKGGKRLPKGVNLIKAPNNHPYIRVQDLGHEKTLELNSSYAYVDDETQKFISKYIVNTGDIIMSIVGTIGLIGIVGNTLNNANLTENCVKVVNVSNIEKEYLYYFLISTYGQSEMSKGIVGAVQLKLPIKNIQNISIKAPNLIIQKKISNILQSLDEKIELNCRINENLEQQAQALFKSWFVDFEPFKDGKFVDSELGMIPEGWKVGTLSDIANVTMGQSPKGTSYNENGEGIVFYQGRADFGNRYPSVRLFTTEPTRYADPFSVLLSVRAPVGDINIAVEKCCIGRGLASIYSKTGHQSFVLYTMFSLKKELDKFNSEGTVFGSINRTSIENLRIIIPSIDVIQQFDTLVRSFDIKLFDLFKETENFKKIRDTLLPKLMSGELKLSEIDTNLNDHIND